MPVPYSAATDAFEEARAKREQKEMRRALEADGEKLRQLTGEDHGPYFFDTCPTCQGEGGWDVPRPQHDDPYFCVHETCRECNGVGLVQVDAPSAVSASERGT